MPPDGTLLREPDGTIAVVAGGAAFYFISMDELNAAGYGGRAYVSVPQGFIATMPAQPADGTLVRAEGEAGARRITAGQRAVATAQAGETVTTLGLTVFRAIPQA